MQINQAFRYELKPSKRQLCLLRKHAGTARFVYNWGLAERIRIFKENEGKKKFVSAIDQHKSWNIWKRENATWWKEISKCAPQEALRNLDKAFRNFWKNKHKVGFPKFKKKGIHDSFRLTGSLKILKKKKIQIPRIGKLRTKESTEKFKGRILSATISRECDRWYCSFSVIVERPNPKQIEGEIVGIDLGITHFATFSNGIKIDNPKPLLSNLKLLKRRSRQHSRKKKGSNNRKKSVLTLSRLHRRIRNQRKDFLTKLSSNLTKTKSIIILEDLNVKEMLKNRRLSRSISDVSWSEFRRMIDYKSNWYGSKLVIADRFFPSSKICSVCGNKKEKLSLSERTYSCNNCGIRIDRDINAAKNLVKWYTGSSPGINACGDRNPDDLEIIREISVDETRINSGQLSTF